MRGGTTTDVLDAGSEGCAGGTGVLGCAGACALGKASTPGEPTMEGVYIVGGVGTAPMLMVGISNFGRLKSSMNAGTDAGTPTEVLTEETWMGP